MLVAIIVANDVFVSTILVIENSSETSRTLDRKRPTKLAIIYATVPHASSNIEIRLLNTWPYFVTISA